MHGTVQSVGAAADGFHGPHRSCMGCNQLGAEHKSPRTNGDRAPSNIYSCMEPPASPAPSEVSALIVPEVSVFEAVPPSASTHCGCFACFTRRVTNGWTRLSYKRHVRTIFVFLLLFTMWSVLTKKKTNRHVFFFCSLSSDCDAGTHREHWTCDCANVWKKKKKEKNKKIWILSSRDIQTRGIVSVGFFVLNVWTLSELITQDEPALCFKCLLHILKDALIPYFPPHVTFRVLSGPSASRRSAWLL